MTKEEVIQKLEWYVEEMTDKFMINAYTLGNLVSAMSLLSELKGWKTGKDE